MDKKWHISGAPNKVSELMDAMGVDIASDACLQKAHTVAKNQDLIFAETVIYTRVHVCVLVDRVAGRL